MHSRRAEDRSAYAWGNVVNHTGSTQQPYQYVGQLGYYTHYQDANVDLLQLGVRFYDPEIGRFTQRNSPYTHEDNNPNENNQTDEEYVEHCAMSCFHHSGNQERFKYDNEAIGACAVATRWWRGAGIITAGLAAMSEHKKQLLWDECRQFCNERLENFKRNNGRSPRWGEHGYNHIDFCGWYKKIYWPRERDGRPWPKHTPMPGDPTDPRNKKK